MKTAMVPKTEASRFRSTRFGLSRRCFNRTLAIPVRQSHCITFCPGQASDLMASRASRVTALRVSSRLSIHHFAAPPAEEVAKWCEIMGNHISNGSAQVVTQVVNQLRILPKANDWKGFMNSHRYFT